MDLLDVFNITLDGYSALLCVMMGVHAFFIARGRRDEVSLCFAGICLANAVMSLGDITSAVQVMTFGIALLNASITMSLLIIFFSIQSERKALLARREQELAEARADIMLSQIQPHFPYNTLAAIRETCLSDPTEAACMITDFSVYLRENMTSLTSRAPIPFERELRHVRTYVTIEEKRFGDRLRVEFDIQATAFLLPPLSLQVLVENAVRHGVTKREEGGCVRVSSVEEPDAFVVTVDDVGAGFDPNPARIDGRPHVGLTNVQTRMEALCGGSLEVGSSPGAGTRATLRIPKDADVRGEAADDIPGAFDDGEASVDVIATAAGLAGSAAETVLGASGASRRGSDARGCEFDSGGLDEHHCSGR